MPTLDIPAQFIALAANDYGTVVGAQPLMVNDGDTSYVDIDKPDTTPSFSGYQLNVAFPATPIPGTVDSVDLVTVAKGTASPNAAFNAEGEFWLIFTGLTGSYAEQLTNLDPYVTKAALEAGTVDHINPGIALLNDTHQGPFHTRITYVALRVFYTIQVQPPQRVFPREDGLLGPGARRNYPPPRSRQRSPRTFGGYI